MGPSASLCTSEDLHRLSEATHFDEGEIATMYHRYNSENENGRISRKKFKRLMKALGFESEKFVNCLFYGLLVGEKRSYLTFPDLVAALSVVERGSSEEKFRFAIKLWAQGEVRVSRLELAAFMERIKPMVVERDPDNRYSEVVAGAIRKLQTEAERRIAVDGFTDAMLGSPLFRDMIGEPETTPLE